MALWVIEINDVGLRAFRDGECIDESPGFALLGKRKLALGKAAAERQYHEPRQINNRFWQQLDETPLVNATRTARHHADLAYHHLHDILHRIGQPGEVIVAVPAHYSETQLALLLGILGALNVRVSGLVESATAALAGSAGPGRYRVVDINLHHISQSVIEIDEHTRLLDSQVFEQAGLSRALEASADLIADAFLEQCRFDPLHQAATEQALHDALPTWLATAREHNEVQAGIEFSGNRFQARVVSDEIKRVMRMIVAPVAEAAGDSGALILSDRLAALPGVTEFLAPLANLTGAATAAGIAQHRLQFAPSDAGVGLTTVLPVSSEPNITMSHQAPSSDSSTLPVTHLLCAGVARALDASALLIKHNGLAAGDTRDGAQARVSLHNDRAELEPLSDGVRVNQTLCQTTRKLEPGDHISVANGPDCIAIHVAP